MTVASACHRLLAKLGKPTDTGGDKRALRAGKDAVGQDADGSEDDLELEALHAVIQSVLVARLTAHESRT